LVKEGSKKKKPLPPVDVDEMPFELPDGWEWVRLLDVTSLITEQHRIVAKVDRLMTLCDELEAKLTQSINEREKLMETAVRQVLAV
jgi:hypothetical protein